ncbi:FixH family protein [Lentibacillus sp. N15]|uniref:FixH family protein n=1 Tax=Lentibacillus songyuanensis TaxID=3136161 RepID=UPI0031B9F353
MKKFVLMMVLLAMVILAACSNDEDSSDSDEVKMLDPDFSVPATAKVGEPVEFKVTVTYGGEKETDADKVVFEYWEKDKEDDSTKVDAKNNQDGTYTAEITFEKPGEYEMYSHIDAEGLHTMPKKSMVVEK